MIIICDHCESKYDVPAEALGLRGRSVKCVRCTKTWFAKATTIENEPAVTINTNQHFKKENLPVVKKKKLSIWLSIVIFLLVILNLTVSMFFFSSFWMENIPASKNIYNFFGFREANGLQFKNVAIRNITSGNSRNLLIRGEVYNNSNKTLTLPKMKIMVLKNNKKDVIYKKLIQLSEDNNQKIGPNDIYIINRSLGNVGHDASFIKLDIGDSLSMMSR